MSINLWLSPRLRNEPLSQHCDYNWMESSNMSQMLNSDKCEQLSTIGLALQRVMDNESFTVCEEVLFHPESV